MKLHLGCGSKILKGWVNCDVQTAPGVDVVAPFHELSFAAGSIDEIYICHLLEHFDRHEYREVIQRMYGWLCPGGRLCVAVPDFEACIDQYRKNRNIEVLMGLLIGGQKDPYDYHKMLFDFDLLAKTLREAGFSHVTRYDREDHEVARQGVDDFSAAYLPHMDKSGQLMSLNVMAVK